MNTKDSRPASLAAAHGSARAFDDALTAAKTAGERLADDASQAHRTTGFYLHKLEQIEVHLKGVVIGKFDGKEIAAFLLAEYFKAPNDGTQRPGSSGAAIATEAAQPGSLK